MVAAASSSVPVAFYTTRGIDEHVGVIKRQVDKSLRDPASRQLAVQIVSDAAWRAPRPGDIPHLEAWGTRLKVPDAGQTPCPPRNDLCEVGKVWNFLVENCYYVFDIADVDTFATLRYTLEAGGGDCDDATIGFATLLGAVGFHVAGRVISTLEAPREWVHIYPLVGLPKERPEWWMPLDITVKGAVPGWQFDQIAKVRDYMLV
jgi:hypothetical protein